MIRDHLDATNVTSHVGDMPLAAVVDFFNKKVHRLIESSVDFTMDAAVKGKIWNGHAQEIMAKDPTTRTNTFEVDVCVMDISDLYRRNDSKVAHFQHKMEPFLACYLTVDSHPLGEYGFKEFVCCNLEEVTWKSKGLLCFKCQDPDTRYTSFAHKHLIYGTKKIILVKLPVCYWGSIQGETSS